MTIGKSTPRDPTERLGLAFSIFLHLILLGFILSSPATTPPPPTIVTVTIEPPSILKKSAEKTERIVSPPENKAPVPPPAHTLKLAETDSATEREQVKRGTEGGTPGEQRTNTSNQSNASAKGATKHTTKSDGSTSPSGSKVLPLIKDLKLDDATLQMRFGNEKPQEKQKSSEERRQENLASYSAFSRPPGSGAAFLGTAGISDHLPNLPDGDITLLNAKANTYAGFVRRVAVQVFGELRSQGWERLSMREIQALTDFTTIEAVLSPEGNLLKVKILNSSGSTPFDEVVNLSVNHGARDHNPPPGAKASDGLIHFIFKARSWSQIGADRRSGAPVEHRWLLLATGLE